MTEMNALAAAAVDLAKLAEDLLANGRQYDEWCARHGLRRDQLPYGAMDHMFEADHAEALAKNTLVIPPAEPPCAARETPGNYHFEGRCDHCDAYVHLAHATFGQVEDRYSTGRVKQYQYEAYLYVFTLLSPVRGEPERPWDPEVRAFARRLLRARNFDVPESLGELADGGDA